VFAQTKELLQGLWYSFWVEDVPTNEELEEIKHSEGVPLKMKFLSSSE
jgi:hypothetical protein